MCQVFFSYPSFFFSFILATVGLVLIYLSIAELSSSLVKIRIGVEVATLD